VVDGRQKRMTEFIPIQSIPPEGCRKRSDTMLDIFCLLYGVKKEDVQKAIDSMDFKKAELSLMQFLKK
jgi:hypothetical protein